jgi:hypothetical protein
MTNRQPTRASIDRTARVRTSGLAPVVALLAGLLFTSGCGRHTLPMSRIDAFIALNQIARQAEALRIERDLTIARADQVLPQPRYEETARAIEALSADLERCPTEPYYLQPRHDLGSSLDALSTLYRLVAMAEPAPAEVATARQKFQQHHLLFVQGIAKAAPTVPRSKARAAVTPQSSDATHYQQATALINSGLIKDGYAAMGTLLKRTESDSLQAECRITMARLLLNFQTAEKLRELVSSPSAEGIRLLDAVVETTHYSTVLHEAFMRWRTAQQLYTFGVTNDSPIPNATYNATRDRIIATVREHLHRHRDDHVALHQLRGLALCPNVQRTPDRANSALRDDRELNPPIATGAGSIKGHPPLPATTTLSPTDKQNRGARP